MRVALAIVGAIAALTAAACVAPRSTGNFDREVTELRRATSPPDADGVHYTAPGRTGTSIAANWEFTTQMTWPAYVEWVKLRVPVFTLSDESFGRLIFSRRGDSDRYTLTLDARSTDAPLRVSVAWVGMPE